MQKFYIAFLYFFLIKTFFSFGQDKGFIFSPKVSLGTGTIKSENFNKSYEAISAGFNNAAYYYKAENSNGYNFSVGLSLQYKFSESLAIVAEPAMAWFSSPYNFTIQFKNYQGNITTQKIENKINIKYFNIPFLLKYKPLQDYGFHILAGINLDLIRDARVETRSSAQFYSAYGSPNQYIDLPVAGSNIKGFSSPRISLVGGVGAPVTQILDKKICISIRYSFPITKSEMYTKTDSIEEETVFTYKEKSVIEKTFPQYKLNDFKMSTLSISFSMDIGKY